ncbi:MAG: hypothetical protein K6A41_09500 [Bacteroidales bacterium]|nr:hypothetical protein [Bacteroidales bacterium]
MALLKIIQKHSKFSMQIPHKIIINGQLLGIMQTRELNIQMPPGHYVLTIQSMIPFISASQNVTVQEGVVNYAEFHDREKWWDYLFIIDIILWFADFFFTLPHPWGLVYKIFTNGYFVVWLLYEFLIRKKYFIINTYSKVEEIKKEDD